MARDTAFGAQSSTLPALTNQSEKKVFSAQFFLNYRKTASVTANSHHGQTLQTRALQPSPRYRETAMNPLWPSSLTGVTQWS
ncbi:hypothetical protein HU719_017425 [Pseudomonas sp. SWRI107]|uniref:hypothetical protein n=1 Tax=Pseudomonas farsensis TaxID=2745492 RepID=UPI0016445A41|nr:hypothetical protein [Pseudomonas farsensis]MBV4533177.1 hypothetical protein [Pseudomonas farsensis]